jgi:hypothetical protein
MLSVWPIRVNAGFGESPLLYRNFLAFSGSGGHNIAGIAGAGNLDSASRT